ncbi:MAG: hypothetical protein LBB28_02570 [Synergistaceae bacterium]|jgi:hypothetical protein|nr:hypothetical protein [Synergistaceae bacterium]
MKNFIGLCAAVLVILSGFAAGAGAAEYKPVLCAGQLAGAFSGGEWISGSGKVTVDGKTMSMMEVNADEKLLKRIMASDSGLPCENEFVKKGGKLVFFRADGRKAEAVVTGISLYYEGEASGEAGLSVETDMDIETDWSELIVGVAGDVDAAPRPTVRVSSGDGVTYSCEYAGEKFSVSWNKDKDGGIKGKLTVGDRSWPLEEENEDGPSVIPQSLDDVQGGFFDLDGDGLLELAVYDNGREGFFALFRVDQEKAPEMFSWLYTGAE